MSRRHQFTGARSAFSLASSSRTIERNHADDTGKFDEVKFESSLSNQPRRTWDKSLTEVTKKQEKKFPMFQLRSHPGLSHLGRRYPARKGAQR